MSGKEIKLLAIVGLAVIGITLFTDSCSEFTTPVTTPVTSADAVTLPTTAQIDANKKLGKDASESTPGEQQARQVGVSTKVQAGQITGVDMGQVFTMMQANQLLLVDCRPPIFYHVGHIDGAINLPLKSYDKMIDDRNIDIQRALAEKKIIVLYCQNVKCPDAYAVAKKLALLSHSVSIYKGGWEEWKQSGL